ncbi:MAG TPA: GAF domain-containing protein, partial [Roseiflexaceae bacterium]|nr:GAF domain-containing protein [Roseiflexaceae bacterium]
EATGRPLMETIIPWHAHATYQRHLDPALAASTDVEFDQRFEATAQHRSGRTFPVELTVTVIRTGTSHRLSLFVRDITERRQAEAQLQIQLERHHLLNQITRAIGERQDLASIYQVVIRTLEDQMPLDFCCLLRYDPLTTAFSVTSIGLKSHDLATELMAPANHQIPRDASGLDRCVLGQVLDEPDLATTTAPWLRRLVRGGMRALVAAPLVVESHVFGVLVAARTAPHSFQPGMGDFLRQLSQHVALAAHQADLYRALQDAYDDLRQTQQAVIQQERLRALGQMASGIAHDINNAISPIGIYAELLLEQEPATHSQARSWLETIVRATRDVAATIGRLKEFYVQRATTLDLVPVDLNRMVRQVIDLTRPRWSDMARQQEQTIDVRTDLAANVPLVLGVESEIREALTNLVFNAVDAMPQGGTVTLRTRVADAADKAPGAELRRSVEVSVIDTGTGMDEATRQRCLEPFFTTKGEQG